MPRPFYRKTEAELATGAQTLIDIVTPVPATYGLTAGEVTAYTTKATSFADLLSIATTPATRTSVAIENKNAARKILMAATIDVARTITAVQTVTNGQLLELGLNERIIPQPRPVPPTPPVLELISVAGRIANVRVHSGTSEARRKPFGAIGADIYSFIGTEAPTDPTLFHHEGMATRSKFQITFPNEVASGATVWLSAVWVSARGQRSVGSAPISFTLPGGLVPAAA